jgi:eukaryotic-like serine/threonine-protein kinase
MKHVGVLNRASLSRASWIQLVVTPVLLAGADGALAAKEMSQASAIGAFRHDLARSGAYIDSASGTFGGVLWRKQTGGAVRSSPTIAAGLVLVGSSDANLYALDAGSGKDKWKFEADGPIASSATVAEGRVFMSSYRGTFYALDLRNGHLLWKTTFGADLPQAYEQESGPHPATFNGDFILSSAAVLRDTVIVGGGDGVVHAFDTKSGSARWTYRTGGRVRASPAIDHDTVYVGSYDGSLYAIDFATGRQIWRFDTKGRGLNSADFGYDRRSILSSAAVSDGTVYVGSRDAHLYAVDAANGMLKWSFDYEKDNNTWSVSSPAVRDGVVYSATSDGHFVHAVQAADGKELWRFQTSGPIWSSPSVAGPMVYLTVQSGGLFAIDLRSGKEAWRYPTSSGVLSSPAIADGVAYFGCNDGAIYAIRIDGAQPMRRAVYWDAESAKLSEGTDYAAVRDFFQARGYELLDSANLGDWLARRTADRAPSVAVFATDMLPQSVAGSDPAHGPFRNYLDSGGKVVWIGDPPLLDKVVGDKDVTYDWDSASQLLGVRFQGALVDIANNNRSTPTGIEWGLAPSWLGSWDVPVSSGMSVLAFDDRGFAGAWLKNYGGALGTGFVYVALAGWNTDTLAKLAMVAEYRPLSEKQARATALSVQSGPAN